MDSTRTQNLEAHKERIKQFIEINGPSLPVHISNYLKLDSMIASAFLADLLSEKELRISNLRVGNSPLYFIRGQEFQLEKFANHLPGKEREAFYLLKENMVLDDKLMLPAIRVALRAIKDYALPLEYKGNLYWRFMKVNEGIAIEIIEQGKVNYKPIEEKQINIKQIVKENEAIVKEVERPIEIKEEKIEEKIIEKELELPKLEIKDEIKKEIEELENISEEKPEIKKEIILIKDEKPEIEIVKIKKVRRPKLKEKPEFILNLLKLLGDNNFLVVENEKFKKKDYSAIVNSNGKKYLCIGKDKKTISENDLVFAMKAGQKLKLPVVFVTNGEASKKAIDWMEYYGNLIVYKKMK